MPCRHRSSQVLILESFLQKTFCPYCIHIEHNDDLSDHALVMVPFPLNKSFRILKSNKLISLVHTPPRVNSSRIRFLILKMYLMKKLSV